MSQSYTFKLVYTCIVYNYNMDISNSTEQIYNQMSNHIIRDFNLDNNQFDIILAGQQMGEQAESIPCCNQPFSDFLNNNSYNNSFYIRPSVTRISNNLNQQNTNLTIDLCPICFTDIIPDSSYYNCNHLICSDCYNQWQHTNQSNCNLCPICRSI